MLKQNGIRAAFLAVAALLTVGVLHAAQEIKIAITYDQATPMVQAAMKFADLMKEKTGGRYQVNVYPNGVMGGEKDNLDALMLGELEMSVFGGLQIATLAPKYSFFDAPFVFRDRAHYLAAWNGKLGDAVHKQLVDKNRIRNCGIMGRGYRHISSNRAINSVADMKGLKMRIGQSRPFIDCFSALEAVVIPIALPELFTSLKMGVVESSEGPFEQIYTYKLHEVQSHIAISGHLYSTAQFYVNEDFYRDLSEADRKAFDEAMAEAMAFGDERSITAEQEFRGKLVDAGLTFTSVDIEPFRAKARPALEKLFSELWTVTTLDEIDSY